MSEYTAMLAMPDGAMARKAASRIEGAVVTDNEDAGVWVTWTCESESDAEGINTLQEMRLRAEMFADPHDENFTLFQATPFLILHGTSSIIHSEEVICI